MINGLSCRPVASIKFFRFNADNLQGRQFARIRRFELNCHFGRFVTYRTKSRSGGRSSRSSDFGGGKGLIFPLMRYMCRTKRNFSVLLLWIALALGRCTTSGEPTKVIIVLKAGLVFFHKRKKSVKLNRKLDDFCYSRKMMERRRKALCERPVGTVWLPAP